MIDVNKSVQRVCVELRDIASHMKALRKTMEEEERVSCPYFLFLFCFSREVSTVCVSQQGFDSTFFLDLQF